MGPLNNRVVRPEIDLDRDSLPFPGRKWGRVGKKGWSASRPNQLEVLEGRELPSTITNRNDFGPGSLRQAIEDTPAGGTVDFQPGLSGTITSPTARCT